MAFGFEVKNKSVFPVVTHGEEDKVEVMSQMLNCKEIAYC